MKTRTWVTAVTGDTVRRLRPVTPLLFADMLADVFLFSFLSDPRLGLEGVLLLLVHDVDEVRGAMIKGGGGEGLGATD